MEIIKFGVIKNWKLPISHPFMVRNKYELQENEFYFAFLIFLQWLIQSEFRCFHGCVLSA